MNKILSLILLCLVLSAYSMGRGFNVNDAQITNLEKEYKEMQYQTLGLTFASAVPASAYIALRDEWVDASSYTNFLKMNSAIAMFASFGALAVQSFRMLMNRDSVVDLQKTEEQLWPTQRDQVRKLKNNYRMMQLAYPLALMAAACSGYIMDAHFNYQDPYKDTTYIYTAMIFGLTYGGSLGLFGLMLKNREKIIKIQKGTL